MQARQYHVLLIDLIVTHAYRAAFVLFSEIFFVALCKARDWQFIHIALWDCHHYAVIQVKKRFIIIKIVPESVWPIGSDVLQEG
jgi:hypothetical protein